jgi:hypothetical protein
MIIFKAISPSMFNCLTVTKRLRALTDKVNELEARLEAPEPAATTEAETVADEAAQTIVEPQAVAETVQTDEQATDEDKLTQTDDNEQDYTVTDQVFEDKDLKHPVRVEAKSAGIKSWHVKAIDTLKTELDALKSED